MIERELSIDGCRIVVWRIDEDEEHLAEKCAVQGISTADISAIGNCGCRRQKMAVRLAIAHLVDGGFTLRHTDVVDNNSDNAYPEIDGIAGLSISHSRNYAAVAIADRAGIGVDVEEYSPRVLRVRSRFLSQSEAELIAQDDIHRHILAWTVKEAVYKALPIAGIDFAEGLTLGFDSDGNIDTASALGMECRVSSIATDNYTLTLAIKKQ